MGEIDTALTSSNRIILTGHSLGGAVATLAALMLLNRHAHMALSHPSCPPCCKGLALALLCASVLAVSTASPNTNTGHSYDQMRTHEIVLLQGEAEQ